MATKFGGKNPWPECNALLGSKIMKGSAGVNLLNMPYGHQIWWEESLTIDHRDMDKQLTQYNGSYVCSHKRRLASNADVGFYCVNIMTTSFSSPERIVWTIMSGIITVTRLMSSLGIKDHWVKWIYLWFIHTLYAKGHGENTWIFISPAKKCKFLKVDPGIYFKSCVLKLTDITEQN